MNKMILKNNKIIFKGFENLKKNGAGTFSVLKNNLAIHSEILPKRSNLETFILNNDGNCQYMFMYLEMKRLFGIPEEQEGEIIFFELPNHSYLSIQKFAVNPDVN